MLVVSLSIPCRQNAKDLGQIFDHDASAQLVEVKLVDHRLGERSRQVEEEAAAVMSRRFDDDEVCNNLALRRQQRTEARCPRRELEDIGADKTVQKVARVIARNLDHAAVGSRAAFIERTFPSIQLKLGCRPVSLKSEAPAKAALPPA